MKTIGLEDYYPEGAGRWFRFHENTRVDGRILRPGLALISPRAPDARPELQRSFRAVEAAINSWCEQAKLAA